MTMRTTRSRRPNATASRPARGSGSRTLNEHLAPDPAAHTLDGLAGVSRERWDSLARYPSKSCSSPARGCRGPAYRTNRKGLERRRRSVRLEALMKRASMGLGPHALTLYCDAGHGRLEMAFVDVSGEPRTWRDGCARTQSRTTHTSQGLLESHRVRRLLPLGRSGSRRCRGRSSGGEGDAAARHMLAMPDGRPFPQGRTLRVLVASFRSS